jgi:hypothetical protein
MYPYSGYSGPTVEDETRIAAWSCEEHGVIPDEATHLPNRDNIRTCVWCGNIVRPVYARKPMSEGK